MTKKVQEISLGNYRHKANMSSAGAAMNTAFGDPANKEKNQDTIRRRQAGLGRADARYDKIKQRDAEKAQADRNAADQADRENLPAMMKQFQELVSKFKQLGGDSYQYADRMMPRDREAQQVHQQVRALQARINKAGGEISEDAVAAFLAKGGQIQYGKPQKGPKRPGLSMASKHIGTSKGGKASNISGKGANTGKSNKPVVSTEGTNPEYDDEAGMSDNNLETLRRTIDGIDGLIKPGDNLPEWCQEKIAVAKSMLVAVWDYMQSEQERGAMEGQTNEWKKSTKAPMRPKNPVAKAHQAIGTGSGSHKDKKKELPRKAKHKKQAELAETATYDRRLNVLLEAKVLTSQIRDYRKK